VPAGAEPAALLAVDLVVSPDRQHRRSLIAGLGPPRLALIGWRPQRDRRRRGGGMVAEAPQRQSTLRLAGAAALALLLAGLALLLEPEGRRGAAAVLLAAGVAVGVVVALRVPVPSRRRTPMERLNDAAFLVVLGAVALIAVRLARPWTAALPGLLGGVLIGRALRPPPPPQAPPAAPDSSSEQ
jgi:peptidoglycan/LPS O-acetylase OafA/YrhL